MKKTIFAALMASLLIAGFVIARDIRISPPVVFTDSHTVTIGTSHPYPFQLLSVMMSFPSVQTNDFRILLLRGGTYYTIYAATGAYRTVTWFAGGDIPFTVNDNLIFTNSVSTQATLYYNYEI